MSEWTQMDKNRWLYGVGATRILRLSPVSTTDGKPYLVYANGRYIGRQPSLDAAKAACIEEICKQRGIVT